MIVGSLIMQLLFVNPFKNFYFIYRICIPFKSRRNHGLKTIDLNY